MSDQQRGGSVRASFQESIAEGMDEIEFVEFCIVKAGGSNGKFQKVKASLLIWAGFACFSLFIYAFSFFTLQPVMLCNGQVCQRAEYCTGPSELNSIDYSSKDTIQNWTTSMPNVLCSSNFASLTAYYGTAMIVGYFLGSIFITPHADTIGRKKMNTIVTLIQCFAVTALSGIQLWSVDNMDYAGFGNYYMTVGFCFIMGLSSVPRYNVTMIYALELTTSAHQKMYSVVAQILAGIVSFLLGLYYYFFKNIIYLNMGVVVFELLMAVWFIFCLPESPYFLFKKGMFNEFYDVIQEIAKYNGVDIDTEALRKHQPRKQPQHFKFPADAQQDYNVTEITEDAQGIEKGYEYDDHKAKVSLLGSINEPAQDDDDACEIESRDSRRKDALLASSFGAGDVPVSPMVQSVAKEKKTTVIQNFRLLMKNKLVLFNTLVLCAVWSTASFTFYFVEFYMKFVPVDNIYLLSGIIGCADIFGVGLFYLLVRFSTPKITLITTFTALCIFSGTLFTVLQVTGDYTYEHGQPISSSKSALYSFLIFGMRFSAIIAFSMAYYSNSALSPPALTSSVFALTNICCRFVTIGSPLASDLLSNPSICVSVLSFIALLASFFIQPNTRNIDVTF